MNSERLHDIALLLLRIGVGIIFIHAGWGKVTGIEGTQGFFGNIGIPAPALMAWVVALVEFIGGIMLLVGVKIRIPAILLAITMLVAILTTKLSGDDPFRAMRLDLILMLASVALALTGAGRLAAIREGESKAA
jgi:putative oxidoreductase